MSLKQDMLTEAECRLRHSEEDREIGERLADEMCALCDGVRVSVAMNVITSLLCHIYVKNFKNPDLETLLANVAHNYRLRVRPEIEDCQECADLYTRRTVVLLKSYSVHQRQYLHDEWQHALAKKHYFEECVDSLKELRDDK